MDQKNSKNDIQDVDLSAKCGCIICTTIVYRQTINILVCSVCQKINTDLINYRKNALINIVISGVFLKL
jgi:hypothetical protein